MNHEREASPRRGDQGARQESNRVSLADEFFAYAAGRADAETARRIEAGLDDPQSEVRQFVDALRRKASGEPPAPGDDRFYPTEDDTEETDSNLSSRVAGPWPAAPRLTDRGNSRLLYRRVGYGIAAAACLLVAVGVYFASRNGRGGVEVLVATATPTFSRERGPGEVPLVEIRSDLPGFATVVALAPGRPPETIPGLGGDDIPVQSGVPTLPVPLPPPTTRALLVVTETPAGEPIRRAVRGKAFGPDQLEELKAFLRSTLESKGYRRMAFGSTSFER